MVAGRCTHIFSHFIFQLASRPARIASIAFAKEGPRPRVISVIISTCKDRQIPFAIGIISAASGHRYVDIASLWFDRPACVNVIRIRAWLLQIQMFGKLLKRQICIWLINDRAMAASVSCWQMKMTARLNRGSVICGVATSKWPAESQTAYYGQMIYFVSWHYLSFLRFS